MLINLSVDELLQNLVDKKRDLSIIVEKIDGNTFEVGIGTYNKMESYKTVSARSDRELNVEVFRFYERYIEKHGL